MATTTLPYTPPLQDLPAWLSYSTFLTTVGETAVVTQAVVNLPLTYYGPPVSSFNIV
ncbi:hypothetical protein AURDEDRAFT_112520 [Auricularia subglabra TFB-10046 SS5]|nr:hypothetical protein AURDEDRAFT_112520 [Auricularia subglabra TFB-10046 SS5]